MSKKSTVPAAGPSGKSYIKQLLDAEKAAKEKVAAARKRRQTRLQCARTEAQEQVNALTDELDGKFVAFETKAQKSNEAAFKNIKKETDQFIVIMTRQCKEKAEQVVADLIEFVMDIKPELHRNYRPSGSDVLEITIIPSESF